MSKSSNRSFVLIVVIALLLVSCRLLDSKGKISNLQSTISAMATQISEENPLQGTDSKTEDESQEEFDNALQLVGQVGGSSAAVAVRGELAYLGQGPRLVVLDVSNPQTPVFIAQSELMPGVVLGVEVDDRYAYVTTRYGGLYIYDFEKSGIPVLLSSILPEHPGCGSMEIKGKLLYIACNPGGLFIVDVSDPAKPKTLSSGVVKGSLVSIAVNGDHAYVADLTAGGMAIVDISDPFNPQQVGFYDGDDLPSTASKMIAGLQVCGADLCLAVFNYGLAVLSLTDPINPTLIGSDSPFIPSGIVVNGDYAYLLSDTDGVFVYDVSNPSQPKQVGMMPTSLGEFEFAVCEMPERGMYIADGKLYIPDQTYGLTIADISEPESPVRVGQYMTPVPDMLTGIKVTGGYAYVVSRSAGFRILDVSDPADMKEVFYDDKRKNLNSQVPTALDVIGSYAFIADANYPFHVYDISGPADWQQVSAIDDEAASSGANNMVIAGQYAYLSGWALKDAFYPGIGLWVIDISNPVNPQAVKFVDMPNDHWSLSIRGTTLYALDGVLDDKEPEPLSLRILDISDGANPQVVKVMQIPELQNLSPSDVFALGDELYLSAGAGGLKRYDISQPQDPVELSMDRTIIPFAYRLNLSAPYLIVNGNMVLDVSDGGHPEMIGYAMEAIEAISSDLVEDLLYISTNAHGVYVYRLKK